MTDNGDGTVTDHLTGLIWLTNANCIGTLNPAFDNDVVAGDGRVSWQHALDFVAGINAGTYNCDDTSNSGSHQTDWRLPNIRELQSLVDYGTFNPTLPAGHPFVNVPLGVPAALAVAYWSSTTYQGGHSFAYIVNFTPQHVIGSYSSKPDDFLSLPFVVARDRLSAFFDYLIR